MTAYALLRLKRCLPLLATLALLPLSPAHAEFSLISTPGASNCGAHTAGAPSCGAAVGNPINVTNGNKYQLEVDLPPLPGELGLEIVRHYNSSAAMVVGQLGAGWRLSYETDLYVLGNSIQILQADGSRRIFARDPKEPGVCASLDPMYGRVLTRRTARGDEYTWEWNDGKKLLFNAQGKLEQIIAPSGAFVTLTRGTKGELLKVTDPQGRQLRLRYLERELAQKHDRFAGVVAIDSPVGQFRYEHGSAVPEGTSQGQPAGLAQAQRLSNLVKVNYPTHYDAARKPYPAAEYGITVSAASRSYHYDDPAPGHHAYLTGITAIGSGSDGKPYGARIASWAYDVNGRGILSTHANDVEKVTLAYPEGGTTVLTNSLGQQTTYRHAVIGGQYRLLEVRGPGCASCGPINVRYGYDKLGRQTDTFLLDSNGQPTTGTHADIDALGRIMKVSTVAYRNGKAQPAQWQLRYEYSGRQIEPTRIVRPSVVPGKEHQIRIAYNQAGQPESVTESGWSPTLGDKSEAMAITRTTSYRYRSINGRSVLAEIDGPLANGPKGSPEDSDITRFTWDSNGSFITAMTVPGDFTSTVTYDDALRPAQLRSSDGHTQQTTALQYNWRGQPEDIRIEAAILNSASSIDERSKLVRTLRYRYDANGRLTSLTQPDNLTTRLQYDAAGRLTHRLLPDGSSIALQRDTEDRLQNVMAYADPSATILAALRYRYDEANHVAQIDDGEGVRNRYQYTDAGQLASVANALGAITQFSYDDNGRLVQRTQAANSAGAATLKLSYDNQGRPSVITDPNGVATRRFYDDFGNKIAEFNLDRGIILTRYDAANRPLARIDESRHTIRYRWDHAGRLTALGEDQQAGLVHYRYAGWQLAEVTGTQDGNDKQPIECTQYERNAFGQVVKETRWLAGMDGAPAQGVTFITHTRYDDAGRRIEQILPDGHRLAWRYGQGEGKAGQLAAMLFDEQVIVTDIAQTQVGGISGYTFGNGITQSTQRDGRGHITQVQAQTRTSDMVWWQRFKAWAGMGSTGTTQVYRQSNRYDAADRLTDITREQGDPRQARAKLRREHYGYDAHNRLTELQPGDGSTTRLRYDRGGNRIVQQDIAPAQPVRVSAQAPSTHDVTAGERRYHYAPGTNRLLAITQTGQASYPPLTAPKTKEEAAQLLRSAWLYHPTGVPLARFESDAADSRRIIYNAARRPLAVYDAHNQLLARYRYNLQGERVGKTVYDSKPGMRQVALHEATGKPAEQGRTTYSLYRDRRLAAEADGAGRITAHYLYLYGQPVAKIEMTLDNSMTHRLWKSVRTFGGLLVRQEADAGDSRAAIYAIHTDHLGTPQVVTNAAQRVVWQADTDAFGTAKITHAALDDGGKAFEMDLRLPGQVFDAESGLHYNYLREYDPELGRYTTPDPLGLAGGMNPYAYVGSNPLVKTDPLGLYEEDVHYYMTYFLALAAGVDARMAYIIATATQYIDNNPATYPLAPNYFTAAWDIVTNNPAVQNRLSSYHFTQTPEDDVSTDPETRYQNPGNAQLVRLFDASIKAGEVGSDCAKAVMYGEYLHAFEDTFAHRRYDNRPIAVNGGLGHAVYGHFPDHTYNETQVFGHDWLYNEDRSLEMEHEVFDRLSSTWSDGKSQSHTWEEIEPILKGIKGVDGAPDVKGFNATKENSSNTNDFAGPSKKIDMLNEQLSKWGYKFVDADGNVENLNLKSKGQGLYDPTMGADDRANFLRYKEDGDSHKAGDLFKQQDFEGAILP